MTFFFSLDIVKNQLEHLSFSCVGCLDHSLYELRQFLAVGFDDAGMFQFVHSDTHDSIAEKSYLGPEVFDVFSELVDVVLARRTFCAQDLPDFEADIINCCDSVFFCSPELGIEVGLCEDSK